MNGTPVLSLAAMAAAKKKSKPGKTYSQARDAMPGGGENGIHFLLLLLPRAPRLPIRPFRNSLRSLLLIETEIENRFYGKLYLPLAVISYLVKFTEFYVNIKGQNYFALFLFIT